jgi:NAD(P)-dependent dehydrogenase (short-subunit alcohol dehydrogenase family)
VTGAAGGRFAGRRALVTGGASGIGRATARRLAGEGARVALLDRDAAVARVAAEMGVAAARADVADERSLEAGVERAAELLGGPPDVLVSSAGVYRVEPLLDTAPEGWDAVLAVNLRGTFLAGRAVVRRLAAAGLPGAIVNLASTAALVADASEPTAGYNASKAGVVALTRQMAAEWAPLGVRVNAVCPGVIDTPMLRLMDDPAAGRAYLHDHVPLARLGTADEVAAVVAFLASDDASYVTGAALPIDGGATAL